MFIFSFNILKTNQQQKRNFYTSQILKSRISTSAQSDCTRETPLFWYRFLGKMTLFSMVFYGSVSIFRNQNKLWNISKILKNVKFWRSLKAENKFIEMKKFFTSEIVYHLTRPAENPIWRQLGMTYKPSHIASF